MDANETAAAAASGALHAASDIGAGALEQVRGAATGVVAGVKVLVREPSRDGA